MRKGNHLKALGAVVLLSGLAGSAKANFVNGDFEGPAFGGPVPTGFTVIGNGSTADNNYHAPTSGVQQGALSTGTTGATFTQNSGSGAVSKSSAETSLGLPANTFAANVTNVSAFTQTLTLQAGNVVIFNADFLTNGLTNGDFGFTTVKLGAGSATLNPAFVTDTAVNPTNPLEDASSQFFRETGYATYSFSVGASGTYTIGFGVAGTTSNPGFSGLLVDDVVVAPLPSVAYGGMALIGGLGLMQVARRRKTVLA